LNARNPKMPIESAPAPAHDVRAGYSARGMDEGILRNSEKISFHQAKGMRMGATNRPSTALIVVTERMLDAEDAGDFVAAAYWAAVRTRVIIRIGNEVGQGRDPA
jgi:hypothetical protein